MAWRVERADQANRDLEAIFDFLVQSALDFGEPLERAVGQALRRFDEIEEALYALKNAPYQGTEDAQFGFRHVTKGRAIYYFELNEKEEILRVFAVFYGGQDHESHVSARLPRGYQ